MEQKTPTNTLIALDQVKQDMNSKSFPALANHPYVIKQLDIFLSEKTPKERQKAINNFQANYMILMSDEKTQKTLASVKDKFTVVQSLINLSKDNLSINPYDKESCLVTYNGRCTGMAMWRGKLKRLQEKGIIRYIDYLEIRYASDTMKELGNGKFSHIPNPNRPATDPKVEVLMVVLMSDGRPKYKRVSAEDINKRRAKSPMKDSIWKEWENEMWKKTAIGMFESEIGVKALHFHDEEKELEDAFEEQSPDQEETQDTTFENVEEPTQEPEPLVQDVLLRSTLDGIKGLLPDSDRTRLEQKIDNMTDEQLQTAIDAIKDLINKNSSNENQSPI